MEPSNGGRSDALKAVIAKLNDGEAACLRLVAQGYQSKQIARQLDLSPHTVDQRLRSAIAKLGARSRHQAASILSEFDNTSNDLIVGGSHINLIYQQSHIPNNGPAGDGEASLADGNADGDHSLRRNSLAGSHLLSGPMSRERRVSQVVATIFGGENRLGTGQRTLVIISLAIGTALAFGMLVSAALGLSQAFSSP